MKYSDILSQPFFNETQGITIYTFRDMSDVITSTSNLLRVKYETLAR